MFAEPGQLAVPSGSGSILINLLHFVMKRVDIGRAIWYYVYAESRAIEVALERLFGRSRKVSGDLPGDRR
jgi:hypothetical protein